MSAPLPGPRPAAVLPATPVDELEAIKASRRHDVKSLIIARAEAKQARAVVWKLRESRRQLRAQVAHLEEQLAQREASA